MRFHVLAGDRMAFSPNPHTSPGYWRFCSDVGDESNAVFCEQS
ncbi:hypothetical protein RE6C_02738 [Rhodopirellula europaea 6C]|uniref:Uncharacterized protein n=1 Tax=Rhodopirellula europaea 6C TaxID=1263867 RepID=M2B3N5_9BACT|nr:hypothetical protein RE6C_02738 [Rhodopirellula europaea 6C]